MASFGLHVYSVVQSGLDTVCDFLLAWLRLHACILAIRMSLDCQSAADSLPIVEAEFGYIGFA